MKKDINNIIMMILLAIISIAFLLTFHGCTSYEAEYRNEHSLRVTYQDGYDRVIKELSKKCEGIDERPNLKLEIKIDTLSYWTKTDNRTKILTVRIDTFLYSPDYRQYFKVKK